MKWSLDAAKERARAALRAVLPRPVQTAIRRVRGLGPAGTRWFLVRALQRWSGRRRSREEAWPRRPRSILFVCRGNVMRSPAAAALLQGMLEDRDIAVWSAGVIAVAGRPADERMSLVALDHGVSLREHCAQPLSERLVRESDLIVAMDYSNEAALLGRFPWAEAKVRLLGSFRDVGEATRIEILDPWGATTTEMEQCFERLRRHTEVLARRIKASWGG